MANSHVIVTRVASCSVLPVNHLTIFPPIVYWNVLRPLICLRLHAPTFEVQMKSWQKRYIFRPRWGMLRYTRMLPGTMLLVCDVCTHLSGPLLKRPPASIARVYNLKQRGQFSKIQRQGWRKLYSSHFTRKSLRGGGGGCVLLGGLQGCYWWKTVWRTRELHCYIQTENI
jgi:hypothetical protein